MPTKGPQYDIAPADRIHSVSVLLGSEKLPDLETRKSVRPGKGADLYGVPKAATAPQARGKFGSLIPRYCNAAGMHGRCGVVGLEDKLNDQDILNNDQVSTCPTCDLSSSANPPSTCCGIEGVRSDNKSQKRPRPGGRLGVPTADGVDWLLLFLLPALCPLCASLFTLLSGLDVQCSM